MTQDSAESLKAYSEQWPSQGEVKRTLQQFSLGAILAAQDLQPLSGACPISASEVTPAKS